MNEIMTAENSELRKRAETITARINANGQLAARAIYEMAKDLRTMKIEKLYKELGYESFGDYTEQEFSIKERQAHSYISVLEKLGEDVLQSNAQLGITKLSILTQVDAEDRESIMEENDLAGMTVDEVQELIDKVKQQGEQLSMFEDENKKLTEKLSAEDELKKQISELKEKNADLEREVKELESRPIDVAPAPEPIVHEIVKEVPDKKALAAKDREIEQIKAGHSKLLKEIDADHERKMRAIKKEYEDKLAEMKNTAEQAANADKSSFKSIYAEAYKRLSELVGYIKATDTPEDRQLYTERTQALLASVGKSLTAEVAE